MISSLSLVLRQIGDPPILRAMVGVAMWTLVIVSALAAASWWGIDILGSSLWPTESAPGWFHSIIASVVEFAIGLLGVTAGFLVAWLITVGVAQLISEFFRESVIAAVEARHYPELPPPSRLSVGSELVSGLRFIAVLVLANLLALPFYLLAIFIPGLTPILFYTVNGYLFGREYYDLVAQRRLGLPASRSLRRRHRGHLFLVGVVIAIMFSIPLVNLVAPILASAFMVHEFQDLPRGDI